MCSRPQSPSGIADLPRAAAHSFSPSPEPPGLDVASVDAVTCASRMSKVDMQGRAAAVRRQSPRSRTSSGRARMPGAVRVATAPPAGFHSILGRVVESRRSGPNLPQPGSDAWASLAPSGPVSPSSARRPPDPRQRPEGSPLRCDRPRPSAAPGRPLSPPSRPATPELKAVGAYGVQIRRLHHVQLPGRLRIVVERDKAHEDGKAHQPQLPLCGGRREQVELAHEADEDGQPGQREDRCDEHHRHHGGAPCGPGQLRKILGPGL